MEQSTSINEEKSLIESLPNEINIKQLSYLDYENLQRFCQTNAKFNTLYHKKEFWTALIRERFPHVTVPNDPNIDIKLFYKRLFFRYDIDISWAGLHVYHSNSNSNERMLHTLEYRDVDRITAIIILDGLMISINEDSSCREVTIKTKSSENKLVLSSDDDLRKDIEEFNVIRCKLDLASTSIGRSNHSSDNSIEDYRSTILEMLSRDSIAILIDDDPENPSGILSEFFIGSKEYPLSKLLEVIPPIIQNTKVELLSKYQWKERSTTLSRVWNSKYNRVTNKFSLVKESVSLFDEILWERLTYDGSLDEILWNILL
jgi:hypothetical protein